MWNLLTEDYSYRYPFRKVVEQIDLLRKYWPKIDPDPPLRYMREIYHALEHPHWVNGPLVVLRPGFLSPDYRQEILEIFSVLGQTRRFHSRVESLTKLSLQRDHASQRALDNLRRDQPKGGVLIVPAQPGARHRLRSVHAARAAMVRGEFGLGTAEIATMIITHPEVLQTGHDLWIDCAGDNCSPSSTGFLGAPFFCFGSEQVEYNIRLFSAGFDGSGSATGYVTSYKHTNYEIVDFIPSLRQG